MKVAAVAITYFRKFYLRNSFGGAEHDPALIHVGCLYLASKAEETVLNARYFATTMARKLMVLAMQTNQLTQTLLRLHVYAVADEVLRLLERPAGLISPEQCTKLLELPATATMLAG
ncbi:cyclin domain-containing protein [Haematococcus lacustris]|uniref:Cyclin domain-containing protein n=1 Tax=Haematococcus lacustris TaxID=44745 RepID=A0A699YJU0_HAELA|nr:cyclin domain-containing protein [Haematococcus lacustris]